MTETTQKEFANFFEACPAGMQLISPQNLIKLFLQNALSYLRSNKYAFFDFGLRQI